MLEAVHSGGGTVTQTSLEDLKGLSAEALKKLQEEFYIYTVEDFLLRTRSAKKRTKICRALAIDPLQLKALRETAKGLMKSVKYVGALHGWFETGTEGIVWALIEADKEHYEGLQIIEEYDHLLVFADDGKELWNGKIKPDFKKGWERYPGNPKFGQPCALGMWVHWTQKGWEPDDWARLFFRNKGSKPLRAELTKNPPPIS